MIAQARNFTYDRLMKVILKFRGEIDIDQLTRQGLEVGKNLNVQQEYGLTILIVGTLRLGMTLHLLQRSLFLPMMQV